MPSTTLTTYRVEDHRGIVDYLADPERADRLSKAGYRVTAIIEHAGQ